jgi:hypothetical protein
VCETLGAKLPGRREAALKAWLRARADELAFALASQGPLPRGLAGIGGFAAASAELRLMQQAPERSD